MYRVPILIPELLPEKFTGLIYLIYIYNKNLIRSVEIFSIKLRK